MSRDTRFVFLLVLGCACAFACRAQCGFHIEPAAESGWFRAEGWTTPGVADAKWARVVRKTADGKEQSVGLPAGISVSMAVHDHGPNHGYDVWFPDSLFSTEGIEKRLKAARFLLYELVRWEMDGKVYAYSYLLGPYDVACTASVDLIDDKGDGKFRWMVPGGHTLIVPPPNHPEPPPVPEWVKKPKL